MKRIDVKVEGTVSGFAASGETDEEAQARLVLDAEMLANKEGNPRLHLGVKASYDIATVCLNCKGLVCFSHPVGEQTLTLLGHELTAGARVKCIDCGVEFIASFELVPLTLNYPKDFHEAMGIKIP